MNNRFSTTLGRPATIGLRLIIFAAVIWIAMQIATKIYGIVMAVLVAIILTSLLSPIVTWIRKRWRINRYIISILVLLLAFLVIGGLLAAATGVLVNGSDDLTAGITQGLMSLQSWIKGLPFDISLPGIDAMTGTAIEWVSAHSRQLAVGVMSASGSITNFMAMALICLMSTLFFLGDGRSVGIWMLRLVPADQRMAGRRAAGRAWHSLKMYARSQILVAAVDAIGIAVGALIVGVPFVLPIGVLVFFASFIPIMGALFSGAVAVLIALAFGGIIKAIIMLGVILLVQQLESNVWSPILLGGAVSLHPWAVFIGVSIGTVLLGVLGALLAVPTMAAINAAFLGREARGLASVKKSKPKKPLFNKTK